MDIHLIEGSPRTLAAMSERSSEQSRHYLETMGVKVRTDIHVKDYDGEKVILPGGENIPAKTVIWSAGIKGNVPKGIDNDLIARGNRIKTDRLSRVQGYQNMYAIGDVAYMD